MARPKKEGLDYFPLDVDIDQDDKIALIEAKHGLEGFAVVIKLLMKIYKNSYFYEWTEKEQLLFSRRINVDINLLNAIVNDCLEWQLFSEEVFKRHRILTSKGIQSRYLEAVGRRKEVVLNKDYLLITPEDHLKNSKICVIYINADRNAVNVDINFKNEDINPQRKVKERKVNKSKEKDYTSKIIDLSSRYSSIPNFNKLSKEYWDVIRETRTTGNIAESVIYNTMSKWEKFDPVVVQYALKSHIEAHAGKKENYTIGIMRGTDKEEAEDRLNRKEIKLHATKPNKVIDFTKFAEG
jgi:hypothetical protein